MCGEIDGRCDFSHETVRRARKAHRCEECRRQILPGELYTHTASLWEGEINTWKTCGFCARLIAAHASAELALGHSGQFLVGDIADQILECSREEPEYIDLFRRAWRGEVLPPFRSPGRLSEAGRGVSGWAFLLDRHGAVRRCPSSKRPSRALSWHAISAEPRLGRPS